MQVISISSKVCPSAFACISCWFSGGDTGRTSPMGPDASGPERSNSGRTCPTGTDGIGPERLNSGRTSPTGTDGIGPKRGALVGCTASAEAPLPWTEDCIRWANGGSRMWVVQEVSWGSCWVPLPDASGICCKIFWTKSRTSRQKINRYQWVECMNDKRCTFARWINLSLYKVIRYHRQYFRRFLVNQRSGLRDVRIRVDAQCWLGRVIQRTLTARRENGPTRRRLRLWEGRHFPTCCRCLNRRIYLIIGGEPFRQWPRIVLPMLGPENARQCCQTGLCCRQSLLKLPHVLAKSG